jgi:hypothetical protein
VTRREPKHDLPFSKDVTEYCAKRLKALGLEPDRAWMKADNWTVLDVITLGDQAVMAAEARKRVPTSNAIWETSDFYRYGVPLAVFDLFNGPFLRFDQFQLLYLRILGPEAQPWLPSLFLAAASNPTLDPAYRHCLLRALDIKQISTFDPD